MLSQHEPMSCTGVYHADTLDENYLSLYYSDIENNCKCLDPSFILKRDNEQFFIQSTHFGEGNIGKWLPMKFKKYKLGYLMGKQNGKNSNIIS